MIVACNSTQRTLKQEERAELPNVYTELVDFLRTKPGLQITGTGSNIRVIMRGENSLLNNNEPLFVLDGNVIGNTYQQAAVGVDPNSIASIKVITPANAGLYGSRGGNGVIEITTKR